MTEYVSRKLDPLERRAIKNAATPIVDGIHSAGAYFDWSWAGCGFGQLSFDFDRETEILSCNNEYMSRDDVRKILHAFADFVADRVLLDDCPEEVPLINLAEERAEFRREEDEWEKEHGQGT